jgi:hypothetical protein
LSCVAPLTRSSSVRRLSSGQARPPTQEIVAFIDAHRYEVVDGKELGVEPICSVLRKAGLQVAASTPGPIRRLQEDGAFAYLTKPLELRPFLDMVDAALAQSETHHTSDTKDPN